jgi:D-amino peptidase
LRGIFVRRRADKKDDIVIVDDMEGISGINDWHQIFAGCREYEEFGRVQVTEDVNATVRGLRKVGVAEIKVVDFHGSGGPSKNVIAEKLEKDVKLFQGPDLPGRLEKAVSKRTAAALFVGFHAMADTGDGFLRHTINMDPRITINGKPVGETAINAYALAEHGIPVIMVTGDQALVREARMFIPGVETVQVKTSVDCRTTKCLPLPRARKQIEAAAERVFARIDEFKPLQVSKPIRLDISFPHEKQAELCQTIPKASTNSKTVSYTADSWEEADEFIKTTLSLANEFHVQKLLTMLNKLEGVGKITFKWAENRINEWLSSART